MSKKTKSEGERFSLYFPKEQIALYDYVNSRLDENGRKISRNKYIIQLIEDDMNKDISKEKKSNSSDDKILKELNEIKHLIKNLKVVGISETLVEEQGITRDEDIVLTQEMMDDLDNDDF